MFQPAHILRREKEHRMEMYIYIYEGKLKIKHIEEEGRKPR